MLGNFVSKLIGVDGPLTCKKLISCSALPLVLTFNTCTKPQAKCVKLKRPSYQVHCNRVQRTDQILQGCVLLAC